MTSRERITAALDFEPPDRLPVSDSLWDGLHQEWIEEGMPPDVSPADHFGWDIESMFIDASPRFDMIMHSRRDGWITYEDRAGYTVRKLDGRSGTLDFLDRHGFDRDGRMFFHLTRDGRPLRKRRYAYSEAFAAIAHAAHAKAAGRL